jgi:hypothetical protein
MQQEGRVAYANPLGGATEAGRSRGAPSAIFGGFRDDKDQETIELLRKFITEFRTSSNEPIYRYEKDVSALYPLPRGLQF